MSITLEYMYYMYAKTKELVMLAHTPTHTGTHIPTQTCTHAHVHTHALDHSRCEFFSLLLL